MTCSVCVTELNQCQCADRMERIVAVSASPHILLNLGKTLRAGDRVLYEEEGDVLRCEVVENTSVPEMEHFTLKIIEVLRTSFAAVDGEVFSISKSANAGFYAGLWSMKPEVTK